MKEVMIPLFWGTLGTLGFSLFFRVPLRHLPAAAVGGALSLACYLLMRSGEQSVFFSTLSAAFAACFWAEGMARLRKAPANIFLIPGIIPLLPGSALYFAMEAVVTSDMEAFVRKGSEAGFVAVGIAGGILIASEIVRLLLYLQQVRKTVGQGNEAGTEGQPANQSERH